MPLADLEELLLDCRTPSSKALLKEAISCIHNKAYRAAIISCWNALLFDYVHKLNELRVHGDANAKIVLDQFDSYIDSNNLSALLKFEKDFLEKATYEFQFITLSEKGDLARIYEDRNNCSHVSVIEGYQPFMPSEELCRLHVRNAINLFIKHPPTQGKKALDRIISDIENSTFPFVAEDAQKLLEYGPLKRPKDSLFKDVVKYNLKNIFSHDYKPNHLVALQALSLMNKGLFYEQIQDKINSFIQEIADNAILKNSWLFVKAIPGTLRYIEDAGKIKMKGIFAVQFDEDIFECLAIAHSIDEFQEDVQRLIQNSTIRLNGFQYCTLVRLRSKEYLLELSIQRLHKSNSFDMANTTINNWILPVISYFNDEHIRNILKSASSNSQVNSAHSLDRLLDAIRNKYSEKIEIIERMFEADDIDGRFSWIIHSGE